MTDEIRISTEDSTTRTRRVVVDVPIARVAGSDEAKNDPARVVIVSHSSGEAWTEPLLQIDPPHLTRESWKAVADAAAKAWTAFDRLAAGK